MYSTEFFQECAARLRPGGLMCTWAPTPRVLATFASVFPHVLANKTHNILLGSRGSLPRSSAAWQERIASPGVADWLGEEHAADVGAALLEMRVLRARPDVSPNRDLFPRDEFAVP